jgi:hypothetical protein
VKGRSELSAKVGYVTFFFYHSCPTTMRTSVIEMYVVEGVLRLKNSGVVSEG